MKQTIENKIDWTRINNDVNGNPRYVCHFLSIPLSLKDIQRVNYLQDKKRIHNIEAKYIVALEKARTLGGRKFHNKQYGGGIVFQSYNIAETKRQILELIK